MLASNLVACYCHRGQNTHAAPMVFHQSHSNQDLVAVVCNCTWLSGRGAATAQSQMHAAKISRSLPCCRSLGTEPVKATAGEMPRQVQVASRQLAALPERSPLASACTLHVLAVLNWLVTNLSLLFLYPAGSCRHPRCGCMSHLSPESWPARAVWRSLLVTRACTKCQFSEDICQLAV